MSDIVTTGRILRVNLTKAAREVDLATTPDAREAAFQRFCRVHKRLATHLRASAPRDPVHISEVIDKVFDAIVARCTARE